MQNVLTCTNLYFSVFSFYIMQLSYHSAVSHFLLISLFFLLLVLSCVCLLLTFFPSVLFSSLSTNSVLIWAPSVLHLAFLFFSLCLLSFFLHQIFKLFLVYTSLTPMPHYRLMAPTVGFSPPLCVTLPFLTPTSAYITPLYSVCPLFDCSVHFWVIFYSFLVVL